MAPINPDTATEDEIAQALWNLVHAEGSRPQDDWDNISEDTRNVVRQDARQVRAIWDGWSAIPQDPSWRYGDPLVAAVMSMASSVLNTEGTQR